MEATVETNLPLNATLRRRISAGIKHKLIWFWRRLVAMRYEFFILAFFAFVGLIFLLPSMYHTIPAGTVGVHWSRFGGGTQTEKIFKEGYRLTPPWDDVYIYDARVQKAEQTVKALSSDGLEITLDLVWIFRIRPEQAGNLHKAFGPDYGEKLIAPIVTARARDVVAVYRPDEVYTDARLRLQSQVLCTARDDIRRNFGLPIQTNNKLLKIKKQPVSGSSNESACAEAVPTEHGWITLDEFMIKAIGLPPGVQEAIVRKNSMFHEMEEYSFRLAREEKEAERKRIEAVGLRNFQEIVSNGMTDPYLRWKGIEATLELAKSNNAKVVIVGSGKNGMPFIQNSDGNEGTRKPDSK